MTYPTELLEKAEFEIATFERVSATTSAELVEEVKRLRALQGEHGQSLLHTRVDAALQQTFRLELADASGTPFAPNERREHLLILFSEMMKGIGRDRFAETPVEVLDQFSVMSVVQNHDTAGLLRSLVNAFMVAYCTPETTARAYLTLLAIEVLRVEVAQARKSAAGGTVH